MHCLNLMAVLCWHVGSMDPMEHQDRLDRQEPVEEVEKKGLVLVDKEERVKMENLEDQVATGLEQQMEQRLVM